MDFRFRGKSSYAADIAAMSEFDRLGHSVMSAQCPLYPGQADIDRRGKKVRFVSH